MRSLWLWMMALLLTVTVSAWASGGGVLTILVVDPDGTPVAEASVQVRGPERRTATTDGAGEATLIDLAPGTYRLEVRAPGYDFGSGEARVRADRVVRQVVTVGYPSEEELSRPSEAPSVVAPAGAAPDVQYYAEPPRSAPAPVAQPVAAAPPAAAFVPSGVPSRLIHHDGWLVLSVPRPYDTLDRVVELTEGAGGRVDRIANRVAVVRIPVARFDEVWAKMLDLGVVVNHELRAQDMTAQIHSLELSRKVLVDSRDRLVALLAKTPSAMERAWITAEIDRLNAAIASLDLQLAASTDLVVMARITIEVTAAEAVVAEHPEHEPDGMGWLAELSPFRHGFDATKRRLNLPVPERMVRLSDQGPLVAESAGRSAFWTDRLEDVPEGTADFWVTTFEDRFAGDFSNPVRTAVADWSCLTLDEPDSPTPYHWQICARPRGSRLELAQAYYPNGDERALYEPAVTAALAAGGGV